MSTWQQLERALQEALMAIPDLPVVPLALEKEIETLKRWLGAGAGKLPPRDLLRDAVRIFRQTGQLANLSVARSACYGSAIRFDANEPPLIETTQFGDLLGRVDEYREEPRGYRKCYRGLLHAYFLYDGEGAPDTGSKNWAELRSYLSQHRQAIHLEGVTPDWVTGINEHPNLLSDDPVSKYGADLLEDDTTTVDRLRANLEIEEASWLIRKLFIARIRAATLESDGAFRRRVQSLLNALAEHPLLENDCLGMILDRYAQISSPELHTGLRDQSVETWGSPWLQKNAPKWSRVSIEARNLVTTWLKLDLIREFFDTLSDDRQTDQRRLKFWQNYHEQIVDMYFALGPRVLGAHGADFRRLRSKMADHLLTLTEGGGAHNNAFIMVIGSNIVVEFGAKGNACFVFGNTNLPFRLKGTVSGDSTGLKHAAHEHRLLHMDSNDRTWEDKFRQTLYQCGIRASTTARPTRTDVPQPNPRSVDKAPVSRQKLIAWLDTNLLLWEDKMANGGNLKVRHHRLDGALADQLRAWGFKYSERQFWYRTDWPE